MPSRERHPNAIRDYALIGDCHTSALVGRDGSIDWLCFPRPDAPAIFSHILDDQHGGNFAVRVPDASVARRYIPDTNVLVTSWSGSEGELEVTDCMPVSSFDPQMPARVRARGSVLRRIRCLSRLRRHGNLRRPNYTIYVRWDRACRQQPRPERDPRR